MAEALGVASMVFSIAGQAAEYQQQKANAKAQQNLAFYNARLEKREADAELAASQEEARRQRMEDERLRSAQRAAFGKSGAALASGSPLAVLGQTAAYQEMNVQDIHRKGAEGYARRQGQYQSLMYQGRIAGANHMSKAALGMGITGSVIQGIPSVVGAASSMPYYAKTIGGAFEQGFSSKSKGF